MDTPLIPEQPISTDKPVPTTHMRTKNAFRGRLERLALALMLLFPSHPNRHNCIKAISEKGEKSAPTVRRAAQHEDATF